MAAKKRLLVAFISIILVLGLLIPSLIALLAKDKPTYPEDTALDDDENEAEGVGEDLTGENEAEGVEEDLIGENEAEGVEEDLMGENEAEGVRDLIGGNEAEGLEKNPVGEDEETAPLRLDEYYTVIAEGVASNGEAYLVGRGFVAYMDGYIDNYTDSFIIPGGNGITVYDSPGGEHIFSLFIQP